MTRETVSFVSSFTGLEGVGRRASFERLSSSRSIGFVSGSDMMVGSGS